MTRNGGDKFQISYLTHERSRYFVTYLQLELARDVSITARSVALACSRRLLPYQESICLGAFSSDLLRRMALRRAVLTAIGLLAMMFDTGAIQISSPSNSDRFDGVLLFFATLPPRRHAA